MPTEAQQRLAAFYDEIVRRAYSGACNHWCRSAPNLEGTGGVTLLPPVGGYVRQEFLDAWPQLSAAVGPGFVLDRYAVEQAFTRILKRDTDIVLPDETRRQLQLAEQEASTVSLLSGHVNLVVQVAVFGDLVFS
jgi:hypothetical protein